MTITLITIDPGLWALGWCAGSTGEIHAAGCSKVGKGMRTPNLGVLAAAHTHNIQETMPSPLDLFGAVSVEGMELRPDDPIYKTRDLCDVQAVGAGVGGLLRGSGGGLFQIVPVSTWKGSVPKSIHHPRILAALDPNERRIVDAACKAAGKTNAKEVLDAVGIFLHSVRRIDKSGAPRT